MSSGTQVNLDWAGTDVTQGGAGVAPAGVPGTGAAGVVYLTDEEILGIDPPSPKVGFDGQARQVTESGDAGDVRDSSSPHESQAPRNDTFRASASEQGASAQMPEWMQAAAADPKNGPEAQQLWREHQEFRAAFSSPEEARAIKELLPGGVKDVLTLREATQSVDRIDAAIFSGDMRAQSEVVAELARANPAAFRAMFAEAAKVLAGMGQSLEAGGKRQEAGDFARTSAATNPLAGGQLENRWQDAGATTAAPITNHESQIANHVFDPAAYAAFERSTNDSVARDVRGSISDTLARVMPEGVADGAAKRIGEDIFNEVHRALAADRALSEQVASVLRDRRFGRVEQERVASLLAGRAKQLVPSVARRVISEWTSTVLSTARSKAARQATAASRVDIAAPGGSLDSMPLRQMSAREVNYASMSDEQILGM